MQNEFFVFKYADIFSNQRSHIASVHRLHRNSPQTSQENLVQTLPLRNNSLSLSLSFCLILPKRWKLILTIFSFCCEIFCRIQTTSFSSDGGSGSRLLISSAQREDTGFYVCSAENVYGSDIFTALLVVMEHADPPRDVVVVERGSRRVKLNWASGFDGNSPITGWVVQVRTEEGGAWQNWTAVTFDVSGLLVADVMGLRPATVYGARISASNQLGIGRPSDVVTFRTAESGEQTSTALFSVPF